MNRKIIFSLVCVIALSGFSTSALAAPSADIVKPAPKADIVNPSDTGCVNGTLCNPLKFKTLHELLTAILNGVVEIGTILLTVMIVYVGFLFVAAQGNEEKIRSARSALVWTVIGGLILLGATAISEVIQATVGTITS